MEAAPFTQPTVPLAGVAPTPDSIPAPEPLLPVQNPTALLRIESMVRHIGAQLAADDIDAAGAARLTSLHRQLIDDLDAVLAPELSEELHRLVSPADDASPGTAAIVNAQLRGWLQGALQTVKFHAMTATAQQHQTATPSPQQQSPEPAHPARPRNRKRPQDAAYL